MNLGEYRFAVRSDLGDFTENFWTNSDINRWINEALEDLFDLYCRGESNLSLLSGVSEYNKPEGFGVPGKMIVYRPDGDFQDCEFTVYDQFLYLAASRTGQGTPTNYTVSPSGKIVVSPVPDKSYSAKLLFSRVLKKLTADTDDPGLPEEANKLVIHYTLARCYMKNERNMAAADGLMSLYEDKKESVSEYIAEKKTGDGYPVLVKNVFQI